MSTPANNFKLGVFTLCGLLIFILAVVAFGARNYFEPTSLFETYVEGDVTGLAVGSTVELRGVRVGVGADGGRVPAGDVAGVLGTGRQRSVRSRSGRRTGDHGKRGLSGAGRA